MNRPVKRRYNATRRQEQARETERQILAAAHDLFITQGYGRTTIADIAREAGVSSETIYARFKNKPTVLHRVWDVTVGGDDEDVVFHERPEVKAVRAETDLAKRLMMHARMSTTTARRIGPFLRALQGAASSDQRVADMLAEMDRQRLAGMSVMAAEAAATGQLAVTEEECRDFMWSMTDGYLWSRLVEERDWSDDDFADYLGRMWVAVLVRT